MNEVDPYRLRVSNRMKSLLGIYMETVRTTAMI